MAKHSWQDLPGYSTGTWNEREWQMHAGIQRSFLKHPNSSVWELANLIFGRDDYHILFSTTPENHPENERFYFRTDTGHWRLKPTWRKELKPPDPYARIPIHVDPTFEWVKYLDGGVVRYDYHLWNPTALMNSFLCSGPVLDNMIRVINEPGLPDTKPLSKAVKIHIRTNYLPAMEMKWKEARNTDWWDENFLPVTWDMHRQKLNDFLDDTCHLVSGCLLHHIQVWLDTWTPFFFNCPAIDELFAAGKEKAAKIKAGDFTFNFPED